MNVSENLFRCRWIIGGFLLILCILFEIHGSSLSIYADMFGHHELSDIIIGKYRPIRSDEYVVFTPFALSQYFNDFQMISDIVRAAPTNMFMTYGQAVWHPAIIYRPAQIGYLFLDAGSGLAFFWMGRLIILFLISVEFARLILRLNQRLCILYAVMIAFAPLAQWWWSVNSIAEILAAGQGIVVCWKLYLDCENLRKRFLYAVGFLWCAGIYIFGIYPAWQVSFGYVFLFCLIAISVDSKNALGMLQRDAKFWIIGFVIMLAPIVHAVYVSWDMIQITMATEYPGRRFTLGGGYPLWSFMFYGIDAILPFSNVWTNTNNCEAACFFSMMPLGFIMFFYMLVNDKIKKDSVMIALFLISAFLLFWETFGIPAWFAKISLMSNVTDGRARSAIEFAQLAMVFRGLSLIKIRLPFSWRIGYSSAVALISTICIYHFLPEWFKILKIILVLVFTCAATFLFISPMTNKRYGILLAMMLAIGITVNPINSGVDVIHKMPLGQKISELVQREISNGLPKSNWIVEGLTPIDFPIMYGAPTINSVNVYPVLERWQKFDPTGKDFKIYNRYAHINIFLHNAPTAFEYKQGDLFRLHIHPNDLLKLNVKYIMSNTDDLEKFSNSRVKISKIYQDKNSYIYTVN